MAAYYPPVGFYFKVEVLDLPPNDSDVRFSEVGGLSVELVTEEMPEGGENRFVQRYPVRAKYADLVLKRGLLKDSDVLNWARGCIEDLQIETKDIDVKLLDENGDPLMTWHVVGAYPTRWSISDLNASANAIVVESMQLAYRYFTVDKG